LYKSIVVSRQMGSGGTYVGYMAAKELGLQYLDREILHEASLRLGMDSGSLAHHEERSSGVFENIIKMFSFGTPEVTYTPPVTRPVYDRDLFLLESKIMNSTIDRYGAVIVGRGAFFALKDRPEVLRVFIHAPLDFRVKRIMKAKKMTDYEEAKALVLESDRNRVKFVREVIGVHWRDARNFHLCIDSGAIDFQSVLDIVLKYFKK